jgi:hypothetical protein
MALTWGVTDPRDVYHGVNIPSRREPRQQNRRLPAQIRERPSALREPLRRHALRTLHYHALVGHLHMKGLEHGT